MSSPLSSTSDDPEMSIVQIETRPDDPYSINIWAGLRKSVTLLDYVWRIFRFSTITFCSHGCPVMYVRLQHDKHLCGRRRCVCRLHTAACNDAPVVETSVCPVWLSLIYTHTADLTRHGRGAGHLRDSHACNTVISQNKPSKNGTSFSLQ